MQFKPSTVKSGILPRRRSTHYPTPTKSHPGRLPKVARLQIPRCRLVQNCQRAGRVRPAGQLSSRHFGVTSAADFYPADVTENPETHPGDGALFMPAHRPVWCQDTGGAVRFGATGHFWNVHPKGDAHRAGEVCGRETGVCAGAGPVVDRGAGCDARWNVRVGNGLFFSTKNQL